LTCFCQFTTLRASLNGGKSRQHGSSEPSHVGSEGIETFERVNSLRRTVRILLWSIFAGCIAWFVRRMLSRDGRAETRPFPGSTPAAPLLLRQDPVCGTYVSPEISFTSALPGKIEHFCSAACRELFVRSTRQESSA
jgi:YHS domain-containing protein